MIASKSTREKAACTAERLSAPVVFSVISPIKLLKETASDFSEDRATRLAAALAYYSIFSLAPLIMIVMAIVSAILGPKAAQGELHAQIESSIGPAAAAIVESMLAANEKSGATGWMAVVGVALLMVSASGVFAQLKDALNTVWGIRPRPGRGIRGMVRDRLLSMTMVLGIGFLLLISLALSTAVAMLSNYLAAMLPLPPATWQVLSGLLTFAVVVGLFAMLFKFLPDARLKWNHVWIGSVITALLFTIGKFGLALYLGRSSAGSAYGAAGAIVLVLLWIYYSSIIFLFGAEFTQVYARNRGHQIEPRSYAVRVTEFLRAKQGMVSKETLSEASRASPP